jgi:peptide/nickel transport system substrate-binding protein
MSNYWSSILSRRTNRRRALAATAGLTAGAALLAACGDAGDTANKPRPEAAGPADKSGLLSKPVDTTATAKRGGVLKRNATGDGNLDPNQSVATVSTIHEIGNTRLVTLKQGHFAPAHDNEIAPDIAESWEWSPDGMQITMKIRQGVKFHNLPPVNGRVLDVDDVAFSWKRFSETSPSRGGIANIANPDAPVISVLPADNRTVVIKLKEPLAYVLSYFTGLAQINLIPKEAANPQAVDLRNIMLGAGPFYMSKHEPSVGFTFKRHEDYWDKNNVFIDQIDYPIIPEYAAGMAQFRTGAIHTYAVRQEDVVSLKRDVPSINLYAGDIATSAIQNLVFGRKTPALRDQRVRQAFQRSYDRDTWVDTIENAGRFEKEGIPVEKSWHGAFPGIGHAFDGFRLDPRDAKTFGANAKEYQYDLAEAKKLLAAAGYPNGLDLVSTSPSTGAGSGITTIDARQAMNAEAGLRFKDNVIAYETEFIPKYRDVLADFEGIAYKTGVTISGDPVDRMCQVYWSKSGSQFYGFDVNGKGDGSGDPYVDETLVKARREMDPEKVKTLLTDLQRYLAPKAYTLHGVGGATTFNMAWPVIGNYLVWQGGSGTSVRAQSTRWWIDETQPPLKKT